MLERREAMDRNGGNIRQRTVPMVLIHGNLRTQQTKIGILGRRIDCPGYGSQSTFWITGAPPSTGRCKLNQWIFTLTLGKGLDGLKS